MVRAFPRVRGAPHDSVKCEIWNAGAQGAMNLNPRMHYDVIVLGLGAMGSAAAYHLAARGKRVLGIDQYHPPHDRGSSHGETRMIRQAYGEGADYIPLVLRAYELWGQLERDINQKLLTVTGGLILGAADGPMIRNGIAAARQHAIPFEVLEPREGSRRFPAIKPLPGDVALYEFRAGYLAPEACIEAHLQMAAKHGAELRFDAEVASFKASDRHVELFTSNGKYSADHLVLATGPWAAKTLGEWLPLRVTRQVMAWMEPTGGIDNFLPERFPVFLSESIEDGRPAYGFPAIDGAQGGVKVAVHGSITECTPETVDRTIHAKDITELKEKVARRIPALNGQALKAQTCLYTMTPDEHFVLGIHPQHAMVSVACGFSGHGFKFASVVGEVLADLALTGETRHSIGLFDPKRFSGVRNKLA